MPDAWDEIADWWMDAVRTDPTQSTDTHDVLGDLVGGTSGRTLDLGCGEGQGMRSIGGVVIGADSSMSLLRHARTAGAVVQARLPELSWVRSGVVDRVVSVGLLDLIADYVVFFAEAARVVRPGGHLVVVINHPVMTAPDSTALIDSDGEILWRWGTYLTPGTLPHRVDDEGAGHVVILHHRPLGVLLTAAANAGWVLEVMLERGPGTTTFDREAGDHGDEEIPSLAGFRWRNGSAIPSVPGDAVTPVV